MVEYLVPGPHAKWAKALIGVAVAAVVFGLAASRSAPRGGSNFNRYWKCSGDAVGSCVPLNPKDTQEVKRSYLDCLSHCVVPGQQYFAPEVAATAVDGTAVYTGKCVPAPPNLRTRYTDAPSCEAGPEVAQVWGCSAAKGGCALTTEATGWAGAAGFATCTRACQARATCVNGACALAFSATGSATAACPAGCGPFAPPASCPAGQALCAGANGNGACYFPNCQSCDAATGLVRDKFSPCQSCEGGAVVDAKSNRLTGWSCANGALHELTPAEVCPELTASQLDSMDLVMAGDPLGCVSTATGCGALGRGKCATPNAQFQPCALSQIQGACYTAYPRA